MEPFCDLLPPNGFILDLGSGTGLPFARYFTEKGFKVLGVDISSQMVTMARSNVPKADFIELSMTDLDYHSEFDGVFSNYSMLLLDPTSFRIVAKKIVRSLKKGGIFYLALNEPGQEDENHDEETVVNIMGAKMYSRAYTEEEVLEVFITLGMSKLRILRETVISKVFGVEHVVRYLFKKA